MVRVLGAILGGLFWCTAVWAQEVVNSTVAATSVEPARTGPGIGFWLIVCLFLVFVGFGIFKTFQQEAVFFNGYGDLWVGFIPLLLCLVAVIAASNKSDNAELLGWLGGLGALGYHYFMAFKCNPGKFFLAASIGTGRVTLAFLLPLVAIMAFFGGTSRRQGESMETFQLRDMQAKALSAAVLAGLAFFMRALVERSLQAKTVGPNGPKTPLKMPSVDVGGAVDAESIGEVGRIASDPLYKTSEEDNWASPDIRPTEYDETCAKWMRRISAWGMMKITYSDTGRGIKRAVIDMDKFVELLSSETTEQIYGRYLMERLDLNKLEIIRLYMMNGRKQEEKFILFIEMYPDLKKGLDWSKGLAAY